MIIGALVLGIAAGIASFVTTLVAGGGVLWAIAAYTGGGTLMTLCVLVVACAGRQMDQTAQAGWQPSVSSLLPPGLTR